jgi:hypothetical protein
MISLKVMGAIIRLMASRRLSNLPLLPRSERLSFSGDRNWKVGLWTAAITPLSQLPDVNIWQTGLARFSEVALGSAVATGVVVAESNVFKHWLARSNH